jgi:uncharacterized circularly permuted ATP-grasp superfamily protein
MTVAKNSFYDEWYGVDGTPRELVRELDRWLSGVPVSDLGRRREEADLLFRRLGITFIVYGREEATERLIPFDVVPRVFGAEEWDFIERGAIQRVRAINQFLHDIYHDREIVRAGVVPSDLILANEFYQLQMIGFTPPGNIYTHISGIDLVRVGEKEFYVLEDNLRSPSGVS